MPKKTITYLSIIIIVIGSIFLANGLILAWTVPTESPPDGNVDAPLNVGSTAQTKSGSLRSSTEMRATLFRDGSTGYYANPAGTSIFNDLKTYDDIFVGSSNADDTADMYIADKIYDWDNTGYYINPAGTSKFSTINLGGVSKSSWPSTPATPDTRCDTRNDCLNVYSKDNTGKVLVGWSGGLYSYGPLRSYADWDNTGDDNYIWYDNAENNIMELNTDGNLGIGTTDLEDYRLKVVGLEHGMKVIANGGSAISARGTSWGVGGRGDLIGIGGSGGTCDVKAYGPGTNFCAASSIRWKTNITQIDNALDKVLNLRGVYFDWNEEYGGHHDLGMIAEEVGEYIPEIVIYEDDGVYATDMDYGALTPVLVEAIKEQQTQIEQLKAKNEALQEVICQLKPEAEICN